MRFTNRHRLPAPVVALLSNDTYSRGNSRISVTQLIDSPRIRVLSECHWDDIVEDVSDRIWSLVGKAMHKLAESSPALGAITEQRLFAEVGGWTISGQIDVQHYPDGLALGDYKFTSVKTALREKVEWEQQLNCYAWLAEQNNLTVTSLQIWAVMRDWDRNTALRDPEYPQCAIRVIDIPLWDSAARDAYVRERVKLHQDADKASVFGEDLPYCTASERWTTDSKFAVTATNKSRALRVFDTREEADEFAKTKPESTVEERLGKPLRCGVWCPVSRWCEQYMRGDSHSGRQQH